MVDINTIIEVNREYLFLRFTDGKQDRIHTTRIILESLLPGMIYERDFYQRMERECQELYDKGATELDNMSCPSEEDIKAVGHNLILYFDMLSRRDCFFKKTRENAGRLSILKYATERHKHFDKLYREIQTAYKLCRH